MRDPPEQFGLLGKAGMRCLVRRSDSLCTGEGALLQGRVTLVRGPLEQPVQKFVIRANEGTSILRAPRWRRSFRVALRQCAVPWSRRVKKLVRHSGELSPAPRGGALPGSRCEQLSLGSHHCKDPQSRKTESPAQREGCRFSQDLHRTTLARGRVVLMCGPPKQQRRSRLRGTSRQQNGITGTKEGLPVLPGSLPHNTRRGKCPGSRRANAHSPKATTPQPVQGRAAGSFWVFAVRLSANKVLTGSVGSRIEVQAKSSGVPEKAWLQAGRSPPVSLAPNR
ncbi:hypothetical protein NDU88_005084 [Pleurodeles waltl]|uniref:Uncharacterized protein n=1 Tax=Pleurodeles waltl TaxID=8319 RepID=A0AAV7LWF8_PLEWA|nr:hypothetical protein NDU88_005084 [Pleurodeles waltl]